MASSTQGTLTAYSVVASRTIYSGSIRGRVTCFGCCTPSAKFYEDRGNKEAKSLKSALNSAGSCLALHKYRGVTPRALMFSSCRTNRVLVSAGLWYSSPFRHFPPSGFLHVLTCPIWKTVKVRCFPLSGAVQLQNLIPFACVSAEDGIDLCIP